MTVKQLKRFPQQPLVTPQLPRCDADTSAAPGHAQNWRADHYGDPTRCSRDAVVELDGHNYCRIHGGFKALDMYLTGKLTRVVGTGPTSPGYTEIDATNLVEGRDMTQTTPTRDEAVHELLQSNLIAPGLYATSSVFARGRAAMAAETLTLLASAPAPASGGVDAVLTRADVCRLWQYVVIERPSMTVEGFTNLLLNEIDDRAASLSPAATPVSEAGG